MDEVLENILQSPKLPDYIQEMQQYLQQEQERRKVFYETVKDDEKAEFINGEVVYHSPAKHKHTLIVGNLHFILTRHVRKTRTGIVTMEKALVRLRRNDFEPDICFFRKEIAETFEPDTMFYPVPDFVVEVLSASTEKHDRGVKFVDYALNGVKEYWLIDADRKSVEQYVLENDVFVLAEKVQHGTIRCKVLDGLEIPLKAIFDEEANEEFLSKM